MSSIPFQSFHGRFIITSTVRQFQALGKAGAEIAHSSAEFIHHGTEALNKRRSNTRKVGLTDAYSTQENLVLCICRRFWPVLTSACF